MWPGNPVDAGNQLTLGPDQSADDVIINILGAGIHRSGDLREGIPLVVTAPSPEEWDQITVGVQGFDAEIRRPGLYDINTPTGSAIIIDHDFIQTPQQVLPLADSGGSPNWGWMAILGGALYAISRK